MSAHTPGPWTARLSKACGIVTGFHIAASPHGSTLPVVEAEQRFSVTRKPEQIEANANLIAAAPELLAALRLLVADVAGYEAWQRPCHALDVARFAIAKAEGAK